MFQSLLRMFWASMMSFTAFWMIGSMRAWRSGSTMPETSVRKSVQIAWTYMPEPGLVTPK